MDLQRQGLLNGRDLGGSGSFNGRNLFRRPGFGDGHPYLYDLLSARAILDGVYQSIVKWFSHIRISEVGTAGH